MECKKGLSGEQGRGLFAPRPDKTDDTDSVVLSLD